jgi:hypothetical protein
MFALGQMRRTQREQIGSAIPPCPDLDEVCGHFAEGPISDITRPERFHLGADLIFLELPIPAVTVETTVTVTAPLHALEKAARVRRGCTSSLRPSWPKRRARVGDAQKRPLRSVVPCGTHFGKLPTPVRVGSAF